VRTDGVLAVAGTRPHGEPGLASMSRWEAKNIKCRRAAYHLRCAGPYYDPKRIRTPDGATTMPTGRGGMGPHKHGVSGTPGRNSRYKAAQQREAQKEEDRERQRREKRAPQFTSPIEAIRKFRPK